MKVHIGPYRKNRKIKVEIDEYDLFSIDHTISLIMLPLFKKLREKEKRGVPCWCFKDPNENSEESWQEAEIFWEKTVDKIIWSLEEIATNKATEPEFCGSFVFEPEFKMVGCSNEQYEIWLQDRRVYENRIQEGLDLLGKHFQDFWS